MSGEWDTEAVTQLVIIGPGGAQIVFGESPVPPELASYYAGPPGAPAAVALPETVIGCTLYEDGLGDYAYQVMLLDTSVPMHVVLAEGASVGGQVNESKRFVLNPGVVLGNARYQTFFSSNILILESPNASDTVFACQPAGAPFHTFSINRQGTIGVGPPDGSTLTDVYLTRTPGGDWEMSAAVFIRQFFGTAATSIGLIIDGEAHDRLDILGDGTILQGDGTAAPSWQYLFDNQAGINNAGAVDSTVSGAYANLAGTSSFAFTKHQASTRLKVTMHATWFTATAANGARFGVNIAGTDYDICQLNGSVPINAHLQVSGERYISGVGAGNLTIQGRWLRSTGGGTNSRDTNDWLSITCEECV